MARKKPNKDEVNRVRAMLSDEEIALIRKDNPFRNKRNGGIRQLCELGVKKVIIAELTGLCDDTIGRIYRKGNEAVAQSIRKGLM